MRLLCWDRGFVAELNYTNLFLIKEGAVYTPYANACLPGISRKMTMQVADSLNISCVEADLSLFDFYTSDFVFASGTMGELTPVTEIDGRKIGRQRGESLFSLIHSKYQEVIPWYCERP